MKNKIELLYIEIKETMSSVTVCGQGCRKDDDTCDTDRQCHDREV